MNRATIAGGLTLLLCISVGIRLCLLPTITPDVSSQGRKVASLPPRTTEEDLPEPTIPHPTELGNLTLFELPERRVALTDTSPRPSFELLAIEPVWRSMIVSGHVFDGSSWRVSLRDIKRGLWDTVRPGELSSRLGVRLIEFEQNARGKPRALLTSEDGKTPWEATDERQPSGRFYALVRLHNGSTEYIQEGEPIPDTPWRLEMITGDLNSATFIHQDGAIQILRPMLSSAQP